MPIDLSIDTERDLITRIMRDPVTVDQYIESLAEVLSHPDYHPGMKSLVDIRGVSKQLTGEDIRRIAQFLVRNQEEVGNSRAAVLVSKTVSYGLSRMLQQHVEGAGLALEVTVFYDLDEARHWLGVA